MIFFSVEKETAFDRYVREFYIGFNGEVISLNK